MFLGNAYATIAADDPGSSLLAGIYGKNDGTPIRGVMQGVGKQIADGSLEKISCSNCSWYKKGS